MSETELLETLVTLVEGLTRDEGARTWISRLRALGEIDRKIELRRLVGSFQAAGEDANLAGPVALLAKPEIFSEVCRVLEERAR